MFKHTLLAVAATAPLLGAPAAAQEVRPLENRIRIGVNDNGGGLEYERKLHPRVGLGLSVFTTRIDSWDDWGGWGENWFHRRDRARLTPVTAAAMFHMTPDRVVDFYLGPGLAYMTFSDKERHSRYDDGLGAMFQIGFDVLPKGSKLGFNLDIKHVFDLDDHEDPNVEKATLKVGIVVRF